MIGKVGKFKMQKVVITGGQGDIAQAIYRKLMQLGDYEVLTPGREELDVTDILSVRKYFADKSVDVLVNNAGFVVPQSITDCDINIIKKELDINLFGAFNCTHIVLERNKSAKIINIGSSAATKIHGTWSGYCAAKAAVVMATQCWADDGVDVVCVSPGRTATKMRSGLFPEEDKNTLLKPDDFATIVLYAVEGKYKSGTHINVNLQNVENLKNA